MRYSGRYRPNKLNKRLLKKRVKYGTLSTVAILLIAAIWFFFNLLSSPAKGHQMKVTIKPDQPLVNTTAPAASPPLTNSYFKLNLPPGYEVQKQAANSAYGDLYEQTLIVPGSEGSEIIVITVSLLGAGGLTANPSYSSDILHPSEFIKQNLSINGHSLALFTDNQTGNLVAFWTSGQYLATIGVTSDFVTASSSGSNPEIPVITNLLDGWRWLT